ncbi:hypothetical protein DFH29DRAFT_872737 [Suillus ampliporus]|nr:hypothetical protein DFH29DRAFT_872737 [Suillus ampliporus]
MPTYTPHLGHLPRGPVSAIGQGSSSATGMSLPQFNMTVVPPPNKPLDPSPADDYVNASYVQPLGTRKRYIVTLPATFVDFWTLVWEQNVHVIVILTREIENTMVKCGTYWTDSSYGPLQLQLLDTSPPISPSAPSNTLIDAGFLLFPHLVKRVERAVQESTPGPSPSSSQSNSGSNSGSLSPSSGSPIRSFELMARREDFFSSPPLGTGWRNPELDPKTGVATFALGTGGFIAVDAVLDAVRREMTQRRERRTRTPAVVGVTRKGKREWDGEWWDGCGWNQGKEQEKEKIVGTVPLVMGDRKKSRRHHAHKDAAKEGETSSSESLVVHVPVAGMSQDADSGEQTNDRASADLDTRWQSSSTREWAEQVLDQTHHGEGEGETELPLPLPLSMSLTLPAPSRERSPGSASSSSGPSVLNSADGSVGSGSGNDVGVKAGSGRSGSGSRKSGGSSGSGAFPRSSSVSISHFGSQSNSGPGSYKPKPT